MRISWLFLSEEERKELKENMLCERHLDVIFEEWDGDVSHIIKGRTQSQFAENGVVFECPECIKDDECRPTTTTYYYCYNCGMVEGLPNSRKSKSAQEHYRYFGFREGTLFECYLCNRIVTHAEAFR